MGLRWIWVLCWMGGSSAGWGVPAEAGAPFEGGGVGALLALGGSVGWRTGVVGSGGWGLQSGEEVVLEAADAMPTYDYKCEKCDHLFEVFQSMNDAKLTDCPLEDCDGPVKRLLGTGAGLIFKGGGFYETDYRSDSYKQGAKKDKEGSKSESKSESKSSDSKPSSSTKSSDSK